MLFVIYIYRPIIACVSYISLSDSQPRSEMQYYNLLAAINQCVLQRIIGPTFVNDWAYLNFVETYYLFRIVIRLELFLILSI